MSIRFASVSVAALAVACSGAPGTAPARVASTPCPTPMPASMAGAGDERAVASVIDDFHAAAGLADEQRYFAQLADDAVFLGTDATERWSKPAFRAYAHPYFARGKAWSFRAERRTISFAEGGELAWFEETLATEKLGPARGSGVLRLHAGRWQITQYNLALTIPNERFEAVKAAVTAGPAAQE